MNLCESHFGNDEESFEFDGFEQKFGISRFAIGKIRRDQNTQKDVLKLMNRAQQAECICLHSQCQGFAMNFCQLLIVNSELGNITSKHILIWRHHYHSHAKFAEIYIVETLQKRTIL